MNDYTPRVHKETPLDSNRTISSRSSNNKDELSIDIMDSDLFMMSNGNSPIDTPNNEAASPVSAESPKEANPNFMMLKRMLTKGIKNE